MMKAIVCTKYGSPEVLKVRTVDKPVPGADEVLVKVYATTVNRTDCAVLRAKPFISRLFTGLFKPNKSIPGTEFAGKIEAIGQNVKAFEADDKVFGFDDSGLCAHAQYMKISVNKAITTIPQNVPYEEASASCEGAHYAINFINKVEIKKGQKILVNGASGGIGSAMVQLLKYIGVYIVAVCNTKNIELVKSLGAKKVIDYTQEDFTKRNDKFDFVFDTVGKSTFAKCKPLLHAGGVYISSELGPNSQNIFFALTTPLLSMLRGKRVTKKVIFPYPRNVNKSLLYLKKLMAEGKFKAVIDRKYSFEEIPEAYHYVEKGKKTGNVVIRLEDME